MVLIYNGLPQTDCPVEVVNWRTHGYEFKLGRDGVRKRVVPVTQGVLHWTGGDRDFKACYNTLRGRVTPKAPKGLSIQLYMDQDGKVYQYCDLNLACIHAGSPTNGKSWGIEVANKGFPPASKKWPRGVYRDSVHGERVSMLFMYPEQIDNLIALADYLHRKLFKIPARLIRVDDVVPQGLVPAWRRASFKGLLAHYHISKQKYDPGVHTIQQFEEDGW